MIAAADLANVSDNRGFLATNGIKADAMKLRTADGLPIPFSATFHDEPVQFTNQAPSNLGAGTNEHALAYGDWADFLIGIWSQLDVLVNPYAETAYSQGQCPDPRNGNGRFRRSASRVVRHRDRRDGGLKWTPIAEHWRLGLLRGPSTSKRTTATRCRRCRRRSTSARAARSKCAASMIPRTGPGRLPLAATFRSELSSSERRARAPTTLWRSTE